MKFWVENSNRMQRDNQNLKAIFTHVEAIKKCNQLTITILNSKYKRLEEDPRVSRSSSENFKTVLKISKLTSQMLHCSLQLPGEDKGVKISKLDAIGKISASSREYLEKGQNVKSLFLSLSLDQYSCTVAPLKNFLGFEKTSNVLGVKSTL